MGGRLLAPQIGLRIEQQAAAPGGVDLAAACQLGRPVLGHDAEEFEGLLPVGREVLRHDALQLVERHFLDLHLIQEPGEFASEEQGLVGRHAGIAPQHQLGKQQAAAERRDGGRHVERGAALPIEVVDGQGQLIGVDIAEGAQHRQQQRRSLGAAQKGFPQGPAGAARGQEHQHL